MTTVRRSSQELIATLFRQISLGKLNKQENESQCVSHLPSCFPMTSQEWNQVWSDCLQKIHQGNISQIRNLTFFAQCESIPSKEQDIRNFILTEAQLEANLAAPRSPNVTKYQIQKNTVSDIRNLLDSIQSYLNCLGYNHLGNTFFAVPKHKGANRIFELGREICKQALPMKCLEAVVVASWLTLQIKELDRFMLAFKSQHHEEVYRHIVLVIRYKNEEGRFVYGSLGLSRRDTLMWKAPKYENLMDLVQEYKSAYEKCGHSLLKVKFGMPITHNPSSIEPIIWKKQSIVIYGRVTHLIQNDILEYSKKIRNLQDKSNGS